MENPETLATIGHTWHMIKTNNTIQKDKTMSNTDHTQKKTGMKLDVRER